jgi:hypothetical protein
MHLKVFVKLKKTQKKPKNLLVWAKKPQKTQKNPLGWVFKKKTRVFSNPALKINLHNFSKIKVMKKSQKSRNQGFSYYFCLMIKGSGSVSD